MSIIDKLGDVSRGVSDKTKSMSEISDLKNKILYEQERIYEVFSDIGKMYYKNRNEDPAKFKVLCDDIDIRLRRIKKMEFKLNSLKGRRICPKCNAELNDNFQFCGRCGTRVPDTLEDDIFSK